METQWRLSPPPAGAEELAAATGLPSVVARLLAARGVASRGEAGEFFRPDPAQLHDPHLLKGAEEASDRLVAAARAGKRIVVFGDYDVDGVTAVAQLRAALLRAGADAVAFLPHRLKDGYGLRPDTVRRVLAELSPSVLITVDCGISAVDGVACAREAGVDVIVTDHHLVPELLPEGAVVVNPRQSDCRYPYKELAACGLAFKLAQAVARRAGFALSSESLLRAACLGTIADLVPLTGENRVIAAAGLAALAFPRAPGLAALLSEAGVPAGRAPTSEEVAFRVAPRLNAAGRVDTAELALALFEERDAARGAAIARRLSLLNAERQAVERRVAREAREQIASLGGEPPAVLVLAKAGWHRGVLGIVASRLAREYHRPVLLFGLEGERAGGSGRSIPGVPLHGILSEIEHLFDEFGGHEQAVGASLPAARIPELSEAARALFAERIAPELLVPTETAEAELPLERLTPDLLEALLRFEPHGMGNPRPVFRAGPARAAAPPRALGESGARGLIAREGRPLDFLCWNRGALGPLSREEGAQIHYRVGRGWEGEVEIEIMAARAAALADPPLDASRVPSAASRVQAPAALP